MTTSVNPKPLRVCRRRCAARSGEKSVAGAAERQGAARFDGYDSFDSLYVVSKLTLNGSDADRKRAAVDLSTAVYELIAQRLKWHGVFAIVSDEDGEIKSEAVWKLPELLEGESYLNGMSVISTWDEYAALTDLIRDWEMNLVRSPSFCPVRIEAQRRDHARRGAVRRRRSGQRGAGPAREADPVQGRPGRREPRERRDPDPRTSPSRPTRRTT